ncbi:MAG: aspartate ammonia-lyase [bacterium]|nr:aspartate ammonia-lyase [bacterium]
MRTEKDFLGEVVLPEDFPFGIHTYRAEHNFSFSGERIRPDIFKALIQVKKAAATANTMAHLLDNETGENISAACSDILDNIEAYIPPIHPLQGGAGTSTNMAANELIANITLKNMGKLFGEYETISPLNHINLSQSTNDTYPTAVKIAIIKGLKKLHDSVETFLHQLLKKEKEFAHILKIGRTELQDAMPLSLGQEFSAWAETMTRFRWRLDKALDWIREINISGTAVGTGINADRNYSLHVVEELRKIVQEPLALSRNLVDGTQNIDQIVEVSGLIRTGAAAVKKIAFDLRLLSSGPRCGFGELNLPEIQAGSSIMPGKVNPVMLEAAEQVCIHIMGTDGAIATAASQSNLELPQFLPYIAHTILSNIETFANMLEKLAETITGITPNLDKINDNVNNAFSVATLLTPTLGYEKVAAVVKEAQQTKIPIMDIIKQKKLLNEKTLKKLLSPQVMATPGLPLAEEDDEE